MTRTSRDGVKTRRSYGPLLACRGRTGEQYFSIYSGFEFLEARGEVTPNESALIRGKRRKDECQNHVDDSSRPPHVDLNSRRHPSRRNDPQRPLPSHHSPARTFPSNSLSKPIRLLISFNSECRTPIILRNSSVSSVVISTSSVGSRGRVEEFQFGMGAPSFLPSPSIQAID